MLKVSFDGATALTPEEALDQKLVEMAAWEARWTELPGLTWERRAVKRPARSAAFVGSRPDGTEHASIRFISSGPGGVWVANTWTVCGRTPAPDDPDRASA